VLVFAPTGAEEIAIHARGNSDECDAILGNDRRSQ
jgi:hypothetical protein